MHFEKLVFLEVKNWVQLRLSTFTFYFKSIIWKNTFYFYESNFFDEYFYFYLST